jgi:hypothetical protein
MEAIATLETIQLNSSGERKPVRVEIGKPQYDVWGSWACPVLITTIDEKVREIHGEDSMQALCLGIQFAHEMLQSALERGHRLLEPGDDVQDKEDVDFPLNAYFGIDKSDGGSVRGPTAH